MDVQQALESRHSCRCFLEREVPREQLEEVLRAAFLSPSCENSQPWEIFVAGPKAMCKIRQGYESCRKQKIRADLDNRFDGQWAPQMRGKIDEYFDGICAHEPHKNLDYTLQKRDLFHAQTMIFVCLDRCLPSWSVFDCGSFVQSVMLSATEHGLATIPAAAFVGYPDLIREVLEIPQEKAVLMGIGIGYPDPNAPVNRFKSSRKPISEVVYRGME